MHVIKPQKNYVSALNKASKTGKIADIPQADNDRITAEFRARSEVIDAAEKLASNEGRFAAMVGIDAYIVPKQGSRSRIDKKTGKRLTTEYEDYVVIVNRTAVATRVIRP